MNADILNHKCIVFCEDHFNPLGLCRSLGEAGLEPIVVIFGSKPYIIGRCKYVKRLYRLGSIEEAYNYIVKEFGNEKYKPFLFTTADNTTEFLDMHYDEIVDKFYFNNGGRQGVLSYYMNKENICNVAEKCGIPKPKGVVVKRGEFPKGLKYPVITKVTKSTLGAWKDDVYCCDTEEELQDAYKNIKADEVLVQEFIDKKNELCVDGISINGGEEVWFPFTSEYIRFLKKSYGEYMWIKPYTNEDVRKKIQNILKECHFSGIFSLECLIDKKDDLYFLEVNFRNSTWSYAYTWAGLNLPYQWMKSTLEGHIDYDSAKVRMEPFKAMTEPSDFINSVVREHQVSLWQWIKDVKGCQVHYYYNKKDKMPLFGFFWGRFLTAIKSKFK